MGSFLRRVLGTQQLLLSVLLMSKNKKGFVLEQLSEEWKKNKEILEGYPTVELFEDYLKEIFLEKRPKDEPMHWMRGCRTKGWIDDSQEPFHCGDPDCAPCNYFQDLLTESFYTEDKKFINEKS
jgi:hypothetical protein